MSRIYGLALLAFAAALVAAGCGSSGSGETGKTGGSAYGGEGTTEVTSPPGAESGAAVLTVSKAGKAGPVLVDAKGLTVYDFHGDRGTTSTCYGTCAAAWPPMLTKGPATAGEGAMASKLGTTKRKDGTTQVTYAGHPLYTYVNDKKPGEAKGNDTSAFGGQWYALRANGEEAGG